MYFWLATVNTPARVSEMPGVRSQYGLIATDSQKKFLNGGKNYRLNLPANIPAKDFWSFVVYDPQTRSELQTTQALPSKNSKRDKDILINDDVSVDLYFGPKAPNGKASNWIQTIPEKGWFALLRLYGPLESCFDESWQPNDIQNSINNSSHHLISNEFYSNENLTCFPNCRFRTRPYITILWPSCQSQRSNAQGFQYSNPSRYSNARQSENPHRGSQLF